MDLAYITEEEARKLILEEGKRTSDISCIKDHEGFLNHLIDVGNKSEAVAEKIVKKHPSLAQEIEPGIVRVLGLCMILRKWVMVLKQLN